MGKVEIFVLEEISRFRISSLIENLDNLIFSNSGFTFKIISEVGIKDIFENKVFFFHFIDFMKM